MSVQELSHTHTVLLCVPLRCMQLTDGGQRFVTLAVYLASRPTRTCLTPLASPTLTCRSLSVRYAWNQRQTCGSTSTHQVGLACCNFFAPDMCTSSCMHTVAIWQTAHNGSEAIPAGHVVCEDTWGTRNRLGCHIATTMCMHAGSAARLAAKSADKMARGWSGEDPEGALPDADLLTFEFGLFQVGVAMGCTAVRWGSAALPLSCMWHHPWLRAS